MNQNTHMKPTTQTEVVRLPLWKNALEELKREGIRYGQVIGADWFEERLREKRDSMPFGLAISSIRRELEKDGFYISGRGQKGEQFVILPPSANTKVMQNYSRAATDALKRGVILGTNTRLDTLQPEERARHERVLEHIATRAALLARSKAVYKVVKKHQPNLLKSA